MIKGRNRINQNLVNLALDASVFVAFLVATAPRFSGIAIHEWLSIAFGAAIVTHLLLHWQWIIAVTRRFFGKVQWRSRINYMLNALFFIDVTVILFTGIMISEVALPLFGIRMPRNGTWTMLHRLSSDAGVFILGLHVALHWQWIANAFKRYVITPLFGRRRAPAPALQTSAPASGKEARP